VLNPITNHLRLHTEESTTPTNLGLDLAAWGQLQAAYLGLTGWQLDCRPAPLPPRAELVGSIPTLFGDREGHLYRRRVTDGSATPATEPHALDLAQAITGVLAELQATRGTLQDREAELATAVPVIARRGEGTDFNHRLQAVLRGAVEGLQARAAALYLLDDATSQLKLRSHWGLSSLRFLEAARPLRGAVADLEALTGHAVVIEDTRQLTHWNVPEAFASAVCVPVSSPDTLLGTLWLFADQIRDYTSAETQLLEIIAGRLAMELERRVLVQEAAHNIQHRERSEELLTWHRDNAGQSSPLIDGWQCASATARNGIVCGDFSAWQIGCRDQLRLAAASISGPSTRGTLSATLFQGAVQAVLRQSISPRAMMSILNDVLWSSTSGGDSASTFVASLDPTTGRLDYATAGSTDAYILRPHGWEPIAEDHVPLGQDADWHGCANEQEIHDGDVLLIISDRHLGRRDRNPAFDTTSLAETLLRHVHLSARELSDLAIQRITTQCSDPWARSVLVVKRGEGRGRSGGKPVGR
jgi:phosphoserine phosphatase RsbU/P